MECLRTSPWEMAEAGGRMEGREGGCTAIDHGLNRCVTGCSGPGESAADLRVTTNFSVS